MNEIISIIAFTIMVIMGGVSTLAILIILPATIVWKIYRVFRYGCKITD